MIASTPSAAQKPAATATTTTPILDFFNAVYVPRRLRGAAAMTISKFRGTIRSFAVFLGRPPVLADLTDDHVTDYLWSRLDAGKAKATARTDAKNLLAIWRLAHRRRILNEWPEVELPVDPERIPRALTQDELSRLFAAAENVPGRIADIPAAKWWTPLFRVIWDSRERISAVLSLQWSDVDLPGRYIVIEAEKRKWGRRDKGWPIAPDTAAALEAIRLPARDLVFPWPLNKHYLWRHLKSVTTAAGLPDTRQFKFHAIRRSVASHFAARGGDATALLDHSSVQVTNRYLDPRIVKPQAACDILFSCRGSARR